MGTLVTSSQWTFDIVWNKGLYVRFSQLCRMLLQVLISIRGEVYILISINCVSWDLIYTSDLVISTPTVHMSQLWQDCSQMTWVFCSTVTSVAEDLECSDWSLLKLQYLMWHTQVLQHCCNDSRKTLGMTNLDAKINIELNECLKPSQGAVVSPFPIVSWNSEIKSSEVCQLSSLG